MRARTVIIPFLWLVACSSANEPQPEKFVGDWHGSTADFAFGVRLLGAKCDFGLRCFGSGSGTWAYTAAGEGGSGFVSYESIDPQFPSNPPADLLITLGDLSTNTCFEYRPRLVGKNTLRGTLRQVCVAQRTQFDRELAVKTFTTTLEMVRR